jgi:hypothetical protein
MLILKKMLCLALLFMSNSLYLFGAHLLSFDDFSFENANETGMLSSLQGQIVQVRGFWYPLSVDEGILASQPQLKSCCLQTPAKIEQQLLVKGKSLSSLSPQKALTLEGIFQIQPAHNSKGELIQFFILNQAKEVARPNYSISWVILTGAFMIFVLWWVLKSFKKPA